MIIDFSSLVLRQFNAYYKGGALHVQSEFETQDQNFIKKIREDFDFVEEFSGVSFFSLGDLSAKIDRRGKLTLYTGSNLPNIFIVEIEEILAIAGLGSSIHFKSGEFLLYKKDGEKESLSISF